MPPYQQRFAFLSLLYWLIAMVDITGLALPWAPLHYFAKPLLMPVLMLALCCNGRALGQRNGLMLGGLFFSWAGDVLLLFENRHPVFFIAGLGSFLCAHLLYIAYFLKIKNGQPSPLRQKPWIPALLLAYPAAMVVLFYPTLGNLRIPVLLYACAIITMLLASIHVFRQLPRRPASLFVTGAAFFVLSDSLLAINKFYTPLPFAGVWIMLTYCTAQYCLIKGALLRWYGGVTAM
jgi:uncharacterized membrane protein YhhN